jgi:hypothetical protein
MCVGVNIQRVIGAGLHTGFAADAATGIEIDDAVRAFIERARRANRHTWRVITVIAAVHEKIATGIRELAPLDVLDPRAIHADGDIVFSFTGNGAGMAPDAFALIDDKGILHCMESLSFASKVLRGFASITLKSLSKALPPDEPGRLCPIIPLPANADIIKQG